VTEGRKVQDDPVVLEGEDEPPHEPAPPIEPYTPTPGPRRSTRKAFTVLRIAWAVVVIMLAVVVWAALR
jgi:hypothetical protein